ncbi:MAG TPA: cation diffusion facilitator family transporter [Candidatus Dormibacteraeota bacterium]|nr:cation diffusion facilitator family transporter [Candidatus Dormibacteraeota bacterium]
MNDIDAALPAANRADFEIDAPAIWAKDPPVTSSDDRGAPGHDAPEHDHAEHGHDHDDNDHQAKGIVGLLRGILAPHSHDASESVDSALTASADGMRALKISLAGLAITGGLQALVVILSGSVALLADTIHNFADALTAVPLGIAFLVGRRPPNRRYTYGYGRAEDLAGIFILVTIAVSSVVAAWESIQRLQHPQVLHNLILVGVAGLIGFAGNELVAVYRIRVGRRIGSAALVADGLHARTDGLTSLAVVVGAVAVGAGIAQADAVAGLLITVAILFVLKDAARDIYRRLMDSVDPALVEQVTTVLNSMEGVEQVDAVRIRWVGHELRAEAEVVSDASLSLADAHAIAEEAHHRLLHDVGRLAQATIHTSPCQHDGRDHHTLTAHHVSGREQT